MGDTEKGEVQNTKTRQVRLGPSRQDSMEAPQMWISTSTTKDMSVKGSLSLRPKCCSNELTQSLQIKSTVKDTLDSTVILVSRALPSHTHTLAHSLGRK